MTFLNLVVEISGYGYSRPMWVGPDKWDFNCLDNRARWVMEAVPKAMLLPRIYIDAPPWWLQQNPDELMILDNGTPSFWEKLSKPKGSGVREPPLCDHVSG